MNEVGPSDKRDGCGVGRVGRVARDLGFSVISLDLKNANSNTDILSWDYKEFETWKPRPLCKGDCGKVRNGRHLETAQRLPSGKKSDWGEGCIKHKQDDPYKIPSELISDIFVSLF